jgi:hypothetical protein
MQHNYCFVVVYASMALTRKADKNIKNNRDSNERLANTNSNHYHLRIKLKELGSESR